MVYNCYNYPNTKLKAGDLVFFEVKNFFKSNFVSAVISSSPTTRAFYHVAMIVEAKNNSIQLIDSSPTQGVIITEYKNLCKTHGFYNDIEVSRTNLPTDVIDNVIDNAINLVGSEYNDIFASNFINSKGNKSFYCSQIVQYAFNIAAKRNVFPDIPMNFKDQSNEIAQYWIDYYKAKSLDVPQDMPGSHPASLYESEFLTCF